MVRQQEKPMKMWGILFALATLTACKSVNEQQPGSVTLKQEQPSKVSDIPLPNGYKRITLPAAAEGNYLRNITLKKDNTVYLYNGNKKRNQSAQYAVLDIDVGTKDLQQCADAVMRLRAEYLFQQKKYGQINFTFTNGFACDFEHYAKGYRLKVNGNNCSWFKQQSESYTHSTLRAYLDLVYSYAGTLSLHKQLKPTPLSDMMPGAVFIQTGNPYGHAVTVMDMACNPKTKDTIFLLSQSYMPAQDIHILVNPGNQHLSPWYSLNFDQELETPEWTFRKEDLGNF